MEFPFLTEKDYEEALVCKFEELEVSKYGGAFITDFGELVFIKEVIFAPPKTTILWNDGTKSYSRCCDGDTYSDMSGLLVAIDNRIHGRDNMNRLFDDWLPSDTSGKCRKITISDVRKKYNEREELELEKEKQEHIKRLEQEANKYNMVLVSKDDFKKALDTTVSNMCKLVDNNCN